MIVTILQKVDSIINILLLRFTALSQKVAWINCDNRFVTLKEVYDIGYILFPRYTVFSQEAAWIDCNNPVVNSHN